MKKKLMYKLQQVVAKLYNALGKVHPNQFKYKQQALFYESLKEKYIEVDIRKVRVDHKTSYCNYAGTQHFLKFPFRYLRNIKEITSEKNVNFSFTGIYNNDREWVKRFENEKSSIISFTQHGRDINKFFFDKEYYTILKSSWFVLCPKGDYNWSYRFFESIMCLAIPVIEPAALDKTMEGFFYYTNELPISNYVYDANKALANYVLFLKRHTFLNDIVDIDLLSHNIV